MNSDLNEINQQAEKSISLQNHWPSPHPVSKPQKQSLKPDINEHCLSLQELQVIVEICTQNQQMASKCEILEVERQHYQKLFESAPDGYLITDNQAIIIAANQTALKLLNYSAEELLGKSLIVFLVVSAATSRRYVSYKAVKGNLVCLH